MPRTTLKQLTEKMMAYGQRFPEVTVGHPWGETTLQVRGKNFLFLRHEGDELSFSVKLPRSAVAALALPFVKPTEYGLGRHGWVTCRLRRSRPESRINASRGSTRATPPSRQRSSPRW